MKKNGHFALVIGVSLIVIPAAAGDTAVPEVSGPAFKIKMGEVLKSKRLRNGEEVTVEAVRLDENTRKVTRSNGCVTTNSTEDRYGPNLSWKNCNNRRKWHSGKLASVDREGSLWPFKVGNKVKYTYTRINANGRHFYGAKMSCEVVGTERVEVIAGKFDTYRIDCAYPKATRSYWFAPSVNRTVKFEQNHRKRGRTEWQLVEIVQ